MKTPNQLDSLGIHITRYGLVLVLVWIGGMKFTHYEAEGIKPLVENSPLMSWAYDFLSVQAFSNLLGGVEIVIALMILLRPVAPSVSAIGSGLAAMMFLTTLSFLFTTPGWQADMGFPALSVAPGQFVLKDIVLLGASLMTAGEAWRARRPHQAGVDG